MEKRAIATTAVLVLLGATGCGTNNAESSAENSVPSASGSVASSSPTTSTSASANPTRESTNASPAESADSSECSTQSMQEEVDNAHSQLKPLAARGEPWQWATPYDTSTYDSCADLSWVNTSIEAGTGSSPVQIMLFHQGKFIGTATQFAYGFEPKIERISDDEIAVTYRWPKEGEANASASNTATAKFAWNPETQSVDMTGNLPSYGPTENGSTPAWTGALAQGAYQGVGGGIPDGANPMPSLKQGDSFGFKTPSGNIGCEVLEGALNCGVVSWANEGRPLPGETTPPDWVLLDIGSSAEVETGTRSDPMLWNISPDAAQVVNYGEVVYYDQNVCAVEEAGVTCWQPLTGHGIFINKDDFIAF